MSEPKLVFESPGPATRAADTRPQLIGVVHQGDHDQLRVTAAQIQSGKRLVFVQHYFRPPGHSSWHRDRGVSATPEELPALINNLKEALEWTRANAADPHGGARGGPT